MSTQATVEGSAKRRQRPELLGSDLRRFWNLTWTLAVTDWKLRFYGSALGIAWSLVRPFALFGVLYIVFVKIAKVGGGIINFPAYILVMMVMFQFWVEIVSGCVQCLVTRENLLRKMRFPRLVIPLSVAMTALLNLGTTLTAVLIFVIFGTGVDPQLGWLELFPIVLGLLTFAVGLGLLLGSLFVRYRDIQPIWDVAAQMLFYASPILYVSTKVPGRYLQAFLCNPISSLFHQLRHAMIDPTAPSIFRSMSGGKVLVPFGVVVVTLLLGSWTFSREAPRVAENL